MANSWKNPIIIDTQASDTDYNAAHDSAKGIADGQYTTERLNIAAIKIIGNAGADIISLQDCPSTAATTAVETGNVVFYHKCDATQLNPPMDHFPYDSFVINGLYPKTIGTSCKVYIYLW